MTEKEQKIIKKSNHRDKYNNIFKKEMVKYFTKRGYLVEESNFAFRDRGCKSRQMCQFGTASNRAYPDNIVATYDAKQTQAFNDWEDNGLTLVKTLKMYNEATYSCVVYGCQSETTFKNFLIKIEKYCKEHNMYNEPEKEDELEK